MNIQESMQYLKNIDKDVFNEVCNGHDFFVKQQNGKYLVKHGINKPFVEFKENDLSRFKNEFIWELKYINCKLAKESGYNNQGVL